MTYAATEPAGFPAESRVSCASQKFRNPGVRPFAQFARPPVRIHYHAFKSRGQRDHEPATYRYSSSFLQARPGLRIKVGGFLQSVIYACNLQ